MTHLTNENEFTNNNKIIAMWWFPANHNDFLLKYLLGWQLCCFGLQIRAMGHKGRSEEFKLTGLSDDVSWEDVTALEAAMSRTFMAKIKG